MFQVLVLICAASLAHADCDKATADKVLAVGETKSPERCGFLAQSALAPVADVFDPAKAYVKIVCRHAGRRS